MPTWGGIALEFQGVGDVEGACRQERQVADLDGERLFKGRQPFVKRRSGGALVGTGGGVGGRGQSDGEQDGARVASEVHCVYALADYVFAGKVEWKAWRAISRPARNASVLSIAQCTPP